MDEIGKCSREPYFEEMKDEGKIEVLREAVLYLADSINRLSARQSRTEIHKHVDGEIVIPLYRCEVCESEGINWRIRKLMKQEKR